MMADYIPREAAIEEAIDAADEWDGGYNPHRAAQIRDGINAIPAADVRPVVRGRWIKYAPHNSDMLTCSECEKYWILDGDQYDFHFCPNCGADMREDS